LPVDRREDEEEEEEDPRWDLVRQLVEYKKFKDAAGQLHDRALLQEGVFGLGGPSVVVEPDGPETYLEDVSIFDLIAAFNEVLKKAKPEQIGEVVGQQFSVADKIDEILKLSRERGRITFSGLFGPEPTRNEIICTFLALLELIRLRQVAAVQKHAFAEIELSYCGEEQADEEEAGEEIVPEGVEEAVRD